MKTYSGQRTGEPGDRGETRVIVHEPGKDPKPLDPRLDLRNHSPTGFEWGYAGSGPAQLALALAIDVLGDEDRALNVYQRLKFKVVGRLPVEGWTITEEKLREVIEGIESSRKHASE